MHRQHGTVHAAGIMIHLACLLGLLCCQIDAALNVAPSRAPVQPSSSLDFEVEGVDFRNRSLGLDRGFDVLGHQCSPGRVEPPAPADRRTYTPNRRWPSDAKHGRTALVVLVGGPPQRFQQRMEVRCTSSERNTSLYLGSFPRCVNVSAWRTGLTMPFSSAVHDAQTKE